MHSGSVVDKDKSGPKRTAQAPQAADSFEDLPDLVEDDEADDLPHENEDDEDSLEGHPTRDTDDWRISDSIFSEIQTIAKARGGAMNHELFASADNNHLPKFNTLLDSCWDIVWTGKHFYANPPYRQDIISKTLSKAITDFEASPKNTTLTITVPGWRQTVWWQLTQEFEEIMVIPAGTQAYTAPAAGCYNVEQLEPAGKGRVYIQPTKWDIVVLRKDKHSGKTIPPRMLAHLRLGHKNDRYVSALQAKGISLGVQLDKYSPATSTHQVTCSQACSACRITKATRPPAPPTKRTRSTTPGTLIMADVHGPLIQAYSGAKYCIIFVDDHSRFTVIFFMKTKDEVASKLVIYIKWIRRVLQDHWPHATVQTTIQTDNDKVFVGGDFAKTCTELDISQRFSAPYLHQNQAIVEVRFKVISGSARAMLLTAGMDGRCWPMAYNHANYLDNRSPSTPADPQPFPLATRNIQSASPFELLFLKTFSLVNLKVFGSTAWAFIDENLRGKLDARARPLRYVGHTFNSTAYELWDPENPTYKPVRSGMVTFHERLDEMGKIIFASDSKTMAPLRSEFDLVNLDAPYIPHPTKGKASTIIDQHAYEDRRAGETVAVVKVPSKKEPSGVWVQVSHLLKAAKQHLPLLETFLENRPSKELNRYYPLFEQITARTTKNGSEVWTPGYVTAFDPNHDLKYQVTLPTINDCDPLDLAPKDVLFKDPPTLAALEVIEFQGQKWTEPKTDKQKTSAPDAAEWDESLQEEIDGLVDKGTFELLKDKPTDPPPIRTKVVRKLKKSMVGDPNRRKCRITADGSTQEYGVNYTETFAPSTQLSGFRLFLVLVVNLMLFVGHLDVTQAFLNAHLEENVTIAFPLGVLVQGCRYARLKRSIYGLKQAGHDWYKCVLNFIMDFDPRFKQSNVDACLFFLVVEGTILALLYIHVDDFLVGYASTTWYQLFLKKFMLTFKATDQNGLHHALGIAIYKTSTGYELTQEAPIDEIIKKYGMVDAKTAPTPMIKGAHLVLPEKPDLTTPFPNLLGELSYIGRGTRPDILTPVSMHSRYTTTYDNTLFESLKRIVRYLKGTKHYKFVIKASPSMTSAPGRLVNIPTALYTDADWAADLNGRKSRSGWAIFVFGILVSYGSKLQKTVALSSAEAELMALTEGTKDLQHLLNIITEFLTPILPVPTHVDNQGAICLGTNKVNNQRSKHIDIRYFYCRDLVEQGTIKLLFCPTTEMLADIFTKALANPTFEGLATAIMGLIGEQATKALLEAKA